MVLDDADIYRLSEPVALIAHLRSFLARSGTAPPRLNIPLPDVRSGALLVMPALQERFMGIKALSIVPDNPNHGRPAIAGRYILFDAATGEVRFVLSAAALTNLRTAAVSALAADILAPTDPSTFLMIGTGALSEHMVRAHLAVRGYKTVILWGRDRAKAESLRYRLSDISPQVVVAGPDALAEAQQSADVICAATSSATPLIKAGGLRPNVHIDLVGSFTPAMREAETAIFAGAELIVDTVEAYTKSGDLLSPLAKGLIMAPGLTLSDLLRTGRTVQDRPNVTIFKAVGQALSDLGAAEHLWDTLQSNPLAQIE